MPLKKSVSKILKVIKMACEEESANLRIDEVSLYRHVKETLDLERKPPATAPAEIVEQQVEDILSIEVGDGNRLGTEKEVQAAANWAWVLFRDLFGEYPPTGDEEVYMALVHQVLSLRCPHVVERLPSLS
jgi:hypothetical protein